MDVLADLLDRARARGAAFACTTMYGKDWGLRFGEPARLAVHVVLEGEAVVLCRDAARPVRAGDVVAVRTRSDHALAGHVEAPLTDLDYFIDEPGVRRSERVFVKPGPGPATRFVCGAYRFDGDLCGSLLAALPEVIVVPAARGTALAAVVDLLAAELGADAPGTATVLDRLLDVLLISVLRAHFTAAPGSAPPWYAALGDPAVGTALRAIHEDPGAPFTVTQLAKLASVSRATMAHRFTEMVGVPPSSYITAWRLQLAKEQLRESDKPLPVIAHDIGYGSGYAFATAFKREIGVAPGAWRAAARSA
jgi:AraC-like DNA-binding protein